MSSFHKIAAERHLGHARPPGRPHPRAAGHAGGPQPRPVPYGALGRGCGYCAKTNRSPATCAFCRAISSARPSAGAMSKRRRRMAGPPTVCGSMSGRGKSRTASRLTTGSSTKVLGATVDKRFRLRDGHPFLYETHTFSSGTGAVPVANHAMVRFPAGGCLAFSGKDRIETPPTWLTPIRPRAARGCFIRRPAKTRPACRWPTAASPTSPATPSPSGTRIS